VETSLPDINADINADTNADTSTRWCGGVDEISRPWELTPWVPARPRASPVPDVTG